MLETSSEREKKNLSSLIKLTPRLELFKWSVSGGKEYSTFLLGLGLYSHFIGGIDMIKEVYFAYNSPWAFGKR